MSDPWIEADESSEELVEPSGEERKVFTQSFDLAVQTVLEQWASKTLILPDIQREYVWNDRQASRLIESLLLSIPIPLLYLAETDDSRWEIFDGHQRVLSVVRFFDNEFSLKGLTLLTHLNGFKWKDLAPSEQRQFKRRMLRAVVVTADSHPDMKFEIFERLNTGSIVLRPQELRNSLYRGSFNDLLHELVLIDSFRFCIGTKEPRKRMVDEELVLRFVALRRHLDSYRPPLKHFLNRFMASMKEADDQPELDQDTPTVTEIREVFHSTVNRIAAALGKKAFRLLDPEGNAVDRAPNRAVYDAEMLAFSWIDGELDDDQLSYIRSAVAEICQVPEFQDASRLATGDRTRTVLRVKLMTEALQSTEVPMTNFHIPSFD